MRSHVDVVGRIAHGWAHTASSVGGFERVGEPSARQFGDYTVVELSLTFEAGEGLGRVCPGSRRQGRWPVRAMPTPPSAGSKARPHLGARNPPGNGPDHARSASSYRRLPRPVSNLWVPKTYATWADALGIAVGSVKRLGAGRAGLGPAGGGMIFGLWA